MIRNLLVITGVGFVLALVGVGGSIALVGNDVRRHDWTWVVTDDGSGDSGFRFERGEVDPEINRTLPWSGGDRLSVDLPGEVVYVQGAQAGVAISGAKSVVDRVRFADGRLTLQDSDDVERGYIRWNGSGIRVWSETESLRITVTAPSVKTFQMGRHGELKIQDYDQPTMNVIIDGSGEVRAAGRTDRVDIVVNGDGDVRLDDLEVTDAVVDVPGDGDVRVGPTGRAQIDIAGHGDVTLTRRASQIQQSITGWGDVEQD